MVFVMKIFSNILSVLGFTVALNATAFAAPFLVIDGAGELTGANGVEVDGLLYDVTFGDGTLSTDISVFTTQTAATNASNALKDFVFKGNTFGDSPSLTLGCESNLLCSVFTPYAYDSPTSVNPRTIVYYAAFANYVAGNASDFVASTARPDFSTSSADRTIATWKLSTSVAAVPEPESFAMMFAGLGLLGFVSRRRKQKAAV